MGNPLLTIAGGVAGGMATVAVAERAGLSPVVAGVVASGASVAAAAFVKAPWARQMLISAAGGAAGLVGVQLAAKVAARKTAKPKPHPQPAHDKPRQAEGDFVTRQDLNDGLSKVAAENRQMGCDLLTSIREDIKHANEVQRQQLQVALGQSPNPATAQPAAPLATPAVLIKSGRPGRNDDHERNAEEHRDARDDYERNAYGDERNAEEHRDAYGDEHRDAYADYERNAYEDHRDAFGDDHRDASEEHRDAYGDDHRDAAEEHRDAYGDEHRDAYGEERNAEEHRDAYGEERNADEHRDAPHDD